eukprot:c11202_g1_i1.p1 GENE.c11202_g1_i1~~c11202_g1_i1.p1  ORF type:complete len:323 (-),score=53.42 c11202_g1_i1:10-978(-)
MGSTPPFQRYDLGIFRFFPKPKQFLDGLAHVFHHLHARGLSVPAPVPLPSSSPPAYIHNAELSTKVNPKQVLSVRLCTWVSGKMMCDCPLTPKLFRNVGSYLAALRESLDQFDHAGFRRLNAWDPKNALDFLPNYMWCLDGDSEKLALAEYVLQRYRDLVVPRDGASLLPMGIIQGDFNDSNIICDDAGDAVTGLIDFGESVHSWRVGDLAIAIAYAMITASTSHHNLEQFEQNPHPALHVGRTLFQGFSERFPLTTPEYEVLDCLCATRILTSGTFGWFSLSKDPQNQYLRKHAEPAWNTLALLVGLMKEGQSRGVTSVFL